MFGRSREPFYNWAPLGPFELLGDEFVKDMVAKVKRLSRFALSLSDALDAYTALKNTPVTKSTSSNALKRLQDADLVIKFEHGMYRIQDDALAEWLRNQELDG